MTDAVTALGKTRVFVVSSEGPSLATEQSALDLLGATYGQDIDVIAVPAERLGEPFFTLRTGIAGAFIQKMRNYQQRIAIVGDISMHVAKSNALRDFVYESNKGKDVLFVPDLDALASRL